MTATTKSSDSASGLLDDGPPRVIALVPAYNEQDSIGRTIEALLAQVRPLDEIVVVANNCTDATYEIASGYPVTAVDFPGNPHGKSGALNLGWQRHAQDADYVVCVDADSILPENAVSGWLAEMRPGTGGISGQVVMMGGNLLERIQRSEFARSTRMGLQAGSVAVISGTGCCYSGAALREVAALAREGAPWSCQSITEDHLLTYQLRHLGWRTIMSSSVQVFTGAMPDWRSLWHQRIKWHTGTIEDLLHVGFNKLTFREWRNQFCGFLLFVFWILYPTSLALSAKLGTLHFTWSMLWVPVFFVLTELWMARLVHRRSWKDFLIAGSLVGMYTYTALTMGTLGASWYRVLREKSSAGLWTAQHQAEGIA
jgi:biofilm PGA synthesis N-glycosyltransferase PgaC